MKVLGITDEVTSCSCCGRTNLKCTVAIETSCGDIVHYGRTCAVKNTGKPKKVIEEEAWEVAKLKMVEEIPRLRLAQAEFNQTPESKLRYASEASRLKREEIGAKYQLKYTKI